MGDKIRVAVVFGGQSSEHEVSRFSAESVIRNINADKYEVAMIGITKDGKWLPYDGPVELIGTGEWQALAESRVEHPQALLTAGAAIAEAEKDNKKIDVVFPVLHGCNGEDGTIQGLLELTGIPYVGCGVLSSSLGMDKAYAKIIFEKAGLPQGKYLVCNRKQISKDFEKISDDVDRVLSYPCFVKPSNAGSSVGVSKVRHTGELRAALELAAKYDRRILIEEFIDGREIECAVLGNDDPVASTVGEVIPCNEFYDYEAKYMSGDSSQIIIPAELPAEVIGRIREYSVRAFKALDCSGLARVDFFVRKDNYEVYINEINTMPGFTSISMYSKLWAASGLPYGKLVERLIELALERYEDNRREIEYW
ncbi:MAG: D-alanine--D-alanine ligase [Clostridiaceae bacterium]|jgi:D-alanine-D-alanine ligase|nr:D-alanine--D-alanine ligase [Clostridiaceae bacterium]